MKSFLSTARFLAVLTAGLLVVAVAFSGCDDTDDDDDNGGSATETITDGGELTGDITADVTVKADATVTLKGTVNVLDGATLTIEEGVTFECEAEPEPLSLLVIKQGAKIEAVGTADKPIVFTRDKTSGSWGGIVVNGKAQTNKGIVENGEGNSGEYGADDDSNNDDSSGTIRYVVIRFAGYNFTDEDQLNGLCLQGVGSGTTVEYVHIHRGQDDGVEMFGGTVNLKYIVATGNEDDQIDATDGWKGTVEYAVAVAMNEDGNDKCIEHDSNKTDNLATPVTEISYKYLTAIGGVADTGLARIRRGTQVTFEDSYFCANGDADGSKIIDLHDEASKAELKDNVLFQGAEGADEGLYADEESGATVADNITGSAGEGTDIADPSKFATYDELVNATAADFVTSVGAVTDPENNWMEGWVTFPNDQ